ncbi:hypothetical protein GmHk_18G051178 [Glycine max]|uniref:formin-like protein 5 n=1 Tax=Glycine max TaxID=3847 RepID=UPI0003DE94A2|nr:formin-like protein 5 [Glycine max]KAH1197374.1 hypothetical protein GmHk_18G051178 [Glycine max]
MAVFPGCHTSSSSPFHTATHSHPFPQHPSPSLPHNPSWSAMLPFTVHGCHSPYKASMAAYNHQHYSSSATEDRLEVALAKLTLSQHKLAVSIDTLATTIDNLLHRLPCNSTPHFSSSFLPPPPPPQTPPPPPLLKPTPSPTCTASITIPPPPATTPPPPPPPATTPPPPPVPPVVPIQPRPTTWPDPLPRPVLHLSDHIRPTMPFTKLFSRVPPHGTAMAVYTLPAMAVAFCTTAKLCAIPRNKPWDPGSKGLAGSKKHETHAAGIIVKEDIIVLSRRYVGSGIREYGC